MQIKIDWSTHEMEKKNTLNTKNASNTGNRPTFIVAVEQNFPKEKRILEDNLAAQFFSGPYLFWINLTKRPSIRDWLIRVTERHITGAWSFCLVRKRYIDKCLIDAIAENNIKAIVNLGAGFDTRLYRLPEAQSIPSWEADQPVNIKVKQKAVLKALGKLPANPKQVPINFVTEEIGAVMNHYGYSFSEPTFFIWEAVSQYLDASSVQKTFDFFSKAPSGSRLVFTYVLKDFITGENMRGQEHTYKQYVQGDKSWHFGFDPAHLAEYLRENGWQLIEDVDYAELDRRYVKPLGRTLGVLDIERVAYAKKL